MSEVQDELEPLPAEKLCNKFPPYNHPLKIPGDGHLGNEKRGKMYYKGNDKKEVVITLQKMLRTLKYDLGASGPEKDGVDGKFGDRTEEAVIDFQGKNKDWEGEQLMEEGLVGPRTSDALNRAMVGKKYRTMVGKQYEDQKWYEHYQTPEKLVEGKPYHTVTSEFLGKGLSIVPSKAQDAKVFMVGSIPKTREKLLIRLHDRATEPMTNVNYRLYLGDKHSEGVSEDGWIATEEPADRCVELKVEWGEPDNGGNYPYQLTLAINCDEGEEKEQAIAKLHNIGYSMENKYEENVRAFQQDYDIEGENGLLPGEKLPPNTRKELWDIYGIRDCNASRPYKNQPYPSH